MAYIKLHVNSLSNPYETKKAFEVDISSMITAGVLSFTYSGYCTVPGFTDYIWISSTAGTATDLSQYFTADFPKTPDAPGTIFEHWNIYEQAQTGYVPAGVNLESIQPGQQPADFTTNYNYCILRSATLNGETFYYPHFICHPAEAYDQYTTYYLESSLKMQKLFMADNGLTFGVSQTCLDSYSGATVRAYTLGVQPDYGGFSGYYAAPYYPSINGSAIDGSVYIARWDLVSSNDWFTELTTRAAGSNRVIAFIHFDYDNGSGSRSYYGIACVLMSSVIDTSAYPQQILWMVAFEDPIWGDAISTHTPGGYWGDASQTGGGDGTFTATSDDRGSADGTDIDSIISAQMRLSHLNDVINNGGFNVYQVRPQVVSEIVGILYGSDYFSRFVNSMYNPLSAILAYQLIPSRFIGTSTSSRDLTAGGYNVSQKMQTPEQFPILPSLVHSHIGSANMANFFGAFPDFPPYTEAVLHLPYIGTITIDVNTIARGILAVDYVCDLISGNVCAWVFCQDQDGRKNYIYQGTGNCAFTVPMYSQTADGSAVGKIVGGLSGLVAGGAAGSVGMMASGALALSSGLLAVGARQTHGVGTYSGNVGMLADTLCYLHVQRPHWIQPDTYADLQGVPAAIGGTLSDLGATGRVVCGRIETDGIPATEPELREIERLLAAGVYIKQ